MRNPLVLAAAATATAAVLSLAACSPSVSDDDDDGSSPTPTPTPAAPVALAGPDRSVLAGMRVPLDGTATTGADSYLWAQTGGTPVAIETSNAAVASFLVPPTAGLTTSYSFRLTATSTLGTSTDGLVVTLRAPVFENFLSGIADTNQLNTSEGIDFNDAGMWVVSTQGFVSLFSSSGAFVVRKNTPGTPIGANFRTDGLLLVADAGNQRLETLDVSVEPAVEATVSSSIDPGGGAFGPANYPLPDLNGNVFLSNRAGPGGNDGAVLRFNAGTGLTKVFLSLAGTNPNALAFGPEADRLYVGNIGNVLRIPINSDGTAGTPETYASGLGCEIDGLAFDVTGTLWAGCPGASTMFMIPYHATSPATVVRSFVNPGAGYSGFVSITFGRGGYGDTTLYWTNLGNRTVGRIDIGLPPLDPPLAP